MCSRLAKAGTFKRERNKNMPEINWFVLSDRTTAKEQNDQKKFESKITGKKKVKAANTRRML